MSTETELPVLEVGHAVVGGRCLARQEGKVVLVAGALPGERVRVLTTRDERRFAEAVAVEILEAHERRRVPPCPHAEECGGCDFQHADRELQLSMKRDIVRDAFRRIGKLDVGPLLEGPEAVGPEFGWRNRIRITFDSAGRPGLLRRGSNDVVAIDDCLLMQPVFGRTLLPWMRLLPPWRKATVRLDSEGDTCLLLETGEPPNERNRRRYGALTKGMERPPGLRGILADSIPLAGSRDLHYRVRGFDLRADATSFFQGNLPVAEELVGTVEECLGGDRGLLLDLYAGVGLFAVCLGKGFAQVVAAESDARAVRHLKHNLRRHAVRGKARAEPADVTLRDVPRHAPETVVLDPPRAGLSPQARAVLVERAPERIISVSCDPATAARDTAHLVRAGWRLERLKVIDLFPVTAHVETVALLVRGVPGEEN